MGESLTERRRVVDEVLRDVKTFYDQESHARTYFGTGGFIDPIMNKGLHTLCQQER